MKRKTIIKILKNKIADIAFRVFLWGNEKTEDEYFEEIYQQEKDYEYYNPLL